MHALLCLLFDKVTKHQSTCKEVFYTAVFYYPAAIFIGGFLYQIKGDSHSYVQTWHVHGGQLKQAKRVQWSRVAGYPPITDAAVVAEVDGAMERWKLLLAGKVGGKRETKTGGGEEGYDTEQSRHGSRMSRAKKPKLGAKGGAILPPKPPPASPSPPLREHLKDTQAQLRLRIVELEKVRKESATAQQAAEDMLREERVKWEEERREKDSEIRDLRVKLHDASVRASKKGPASPGLGEGGERYGRPEEFFAAGSNGNQGWPCPSHHIH